MDYSRHLPLIDIRLHLVYSIRRRSHTHLNHFALTHGAIAVTREVTPCAPNSSPWAMFPIWVLLVIVSLISVRRQQQN
jgi:hypothetical protein